MFHLIPLGLGKLTFLALGAVGVASVAKSEKRVVVVQGPPAHRQVPATGGYFKFAGLPCNRCHARTGFTEPAAPGMELLCGSCSGEESH